MTIQAQRAGGGFRGRAMPQSRWGWWSVGLAAAFIFFLTLAQLAVAFGQTGNSPMIVVPFGLALISGTAGLSVGIVGIIWRKERSILVFLSTAVGLVVTALWVEGIVSAFLRVFPPPPPPPNPPPA